MDLVSRPFYVRVGAQTTGIEYPCDAVLCYPAGREQVINLANDPDFLRGAGDEHDAVSVDALVFTAFQNAFRVSLRIDEEPTQPVARGASLAKAQFDQPALAGEDLNRKFTAEFASHGALEALKESRG